jgi:hypothetical protein
VSDSWLERPRLRPHKCHRLNSGAEEHGPYFEESFDYIDPRDPNVGAYGEGQALRLYHSAVWIKAMCEKPGSPFMVMDAEDYTAQIHEYENEIADLTAKIEHLEAEQETLLAAAPTGLDEGKLIDLLDRRYAKKSGRKPAGTAA